MKVKVAVLTLLALCACTGAFAEEKKMVALPKEPVELSPGASNEKEPVAFLHMDLGKEKRNPETSSRTMDKVRCNLNSRYRSCF